MRIFRRKPTNGLLEDERPELTDTIQATVVDDVDKLHERLAALDEKILAFETRLADVDEAAIVLADQGDVIDARIRSAQLSADLHLVAIELKSELQRLRSALPSEQAERLADRLVELTTER